MSRGAWADLTADTHRENLARTNTSRCRCREAGLLEIHS